MQAEKNRKPVFCACITEGSDVEAAKAEELERRGCLPDDSVDWFIIELVPGKFPEGWPPQIEEQQIVPPNEHRGPHITSMKDITPEPETEEPTPGMEAEWKRHVQRLERRGERFMGDDEPPVPVWKGIV